MHSALWRVICLASVRKAVAIGRTRGVPALARAARDSVVWRYSRWLEARFDHRYGVDTCGLHRDLAALGAGGEHLPHAYGYQPVQPRMFRAILRAAQIDPREFAFVDFGSGKGRALLLAAECGFPRIVGVELAPALHEVAERNVAAFCRRRTHAACIELHCGDAVDLEIPDGNVFLSFYNPFGEVVLRKVAANIERAYRARPRQMVIAYRNPRHSQVLDELAVLRCVVSNRSFSLYRQAAQEAVVPLEGPRRVDPLPAT
jgi:SAM-dependent methyltransferase